MLQKTKELHCHNGSRVAAADLDQSDARESYEGSRQRRFSRISDEGPIALPIRNGKSCKDEFPADGDSICHGRKIFADPAPAEQVNDVASERLSTSSRLFAYTRWDAVPVMAAVFHCLYFFALFWLFSRVPLWVMLPLGFTYSVIISWNINGISHYFIHNPYFRSSPLNRLFSVMESITVGFSQVFYECIHLQHNRGNADRPDEHGQTIDWISIYKHGENGEAEHPLKYTFLSFFREDPKTVFRALKRKDRREAFWGATELVLLLVPLLERCGLQRPP